MNNILLIFLGGGLGSVSRFGISEFVRSIFSTSFPFGTLFSNILSCLILTLVVGVFSAKFDVNPAMKTLIVIGFCGGFSTFSTFSFETVELMHAGNIAWAMANILINVISCMALIYIFTKQN